MTDWSYDAWPSGEPYDWHGDGRGKHPDDQIDFHVDLGCGKLKKGRIGVDRYPAAGVSIVADLETRRVYGVAPWPGADAVDPLAGGGARVYTGGLHQRPYFEYLTPDSEWYELTGFRPRLPFEDSSIESMVSHHALEHIGPGFIPLMDECYRVLRHGAPFRIIVPLFPSRTAVEDPDHKRYFMEGTFDAFCGSPGNCWLESFSVPYTKARFELTDKDWTAPWAPEDQWGHDDQGELRVTLRAVKE